MGRNIGTTPVDMSDKNCGSTMIQTEATATKTPITDRIKKTTYKPGRNNCAPKYHTRGCSKSGNANNRQVQ